MIKFCLHIVLMLSTIMVTAQASAIPSLEEVTYIKVENESKLNNLNSRLPINRATNNSTYHAGAIDAMELNINDKTYSSTFCMSCHDGVFVPSGHTNTNFGNPEHIQRSTIFSFNHPVAFEYTSNLALSKDYLNDPYTTPSGLGGTIADDLLVEGRIECVTCHNIFFKPKEKKKYEVLNISNGASGLCLTCHKR